MKKPKQPSYFYIQQAYGKTPIVGARVFHTVTQKYGRITKEDPSAGHYVQVKFEGQNFSLPCHPDELEYNVTDHRIDQVA